MKYIYSVVFCLIFLGCYTLPKAHKQGSRWISSYPADATTTLSTLFPINSTGSDTTNSFDSSFYVKSIGDLKVKLMISKQKEDSLKKSILIKEQQNPQVINDCSEYSQLIISIEDKNSDLEYRLEHIKPIINTIRIRDTVPDNRKLFACDSKNNKLINTNSILVLSNSKLASERDNWRIIAIISLLVNGLFIFLKVKQIFK